MPSSFANLHRQQQKKKQGDWLLNFLSARGSSISNKKVKEHSRCHRQRHSDKTVTSCTNTAADILPASYHPQPYKNHVSIDGTQRLRISAQGILTMMMMPLRYPSVTLNQSSTSNDLLRPGKCPIQGPGTVGRVNALQSILFEYRTLCTDRHRRVLLNI